MTFKTFLAEATILEGGAAIKGSHPLTQAEAREISMHAVRDLRAALGLESNQVAIVGSAGLKAPDQLSGDIDIAVTADITAVKTAVERLALDGRFRHMPGLNVFSYAKLHGSKVAQIDVIPTTNIKLAKWAYYNDPADLKLGLKGSHRNELLFAIAKFAEYVSTAKDPSGEDSARERLVFDLSRGLYRFTQDRAGKRGLTKSFATRDKKLITSDPDKICARLFGEGIGAKQVLTFSDALKLMLSSSFKHKDKLKQIIARAISGLEQKSLVVPHELRTVSLKEQQESLKSKVLKIQQVGAEHGFDYELVQMNKWWRLRHDEAYAKKHPGHKPIDSGYELFIDDEFNDKISERYKEAAKQDWIDNPPRDDDDDYHHRPKRRYSRYDDDDDGEPELPDFLFEGVATNVTVGVDGSAILWCNGTVLQAAPIDELDLVKYISRHEGLTESKLLEGADPELLELQQKLIDDLDDEFDVSLGIQSQFSVRNPKMRGPTGQQYVKLNLFTSNDTYVYLAPKLIARPTHYQYDIDNKFLTYEELLEMIKDKYSYFLEKLDKQRKAANEG
jgi:hypothetical protein